MLNGSEGRIYSPHRRFARGSAAFGDSQRGNVAGELTLITRPQMINIEQTRWTRVCMLKASSMASERAPQVHDPTRKGERSTHRCTSGIGHTENAGAHRLVA